MLNISFFSDSVSLRTASLISPLPLQPKLCPPALSEALTLLLPTYLVPAPDPGLCWGPGGVEQDHTSFLLWKSLFYLEAFAIRAAALPMTFRGCFSFSGARPDPETRTQLAGAICALSCMLHLSLSMPTS